MSRQLRIGASDQPVVIGVIYFFVAIGSMLRPRWLPQKSLPPYAYLPGKNPHPVRDPTGHSYQVEAIPVAAEALLGSDVFLWGLDPFNHGYYWESHEAWEGLWQVADRDGPPRMLFRGLIPLSAAGVKIRERKHAAAARPAKRAAGLLRQLMKVPDRAFERALGMSPAALAEYAGAATRIPADLQTTAPGQPQPVFTIVTSQLPSVPGTRSLGAPLTPTPFWTASCTTRIGFVTRTVASFRLAVRMADDDLVCPPPIFSRNHPARRLALCSFHAQLSRR